MLREDIPTRRRSTEAVEQPAFLRDARERCRRIHDAIARGLDAVAAGLVGAVLAGIEDKELGQAAVRHPAIELHQRAERQARAAQRHVFVIGLIGGGPLGQKGVSGQLRPRRDIVGVIVLKLMVVPGDDPRAVGMGRLEMLVGFVERVAIAVGIERGELSAAMLSHRIGLGSPFVDVVAEVDDHPRIIRHHSRIGRVEALLEVLARREGKTQPRDAVPRCGRRPRPPHRAGGCAGVKPIPIRA